MTNDARRELETIRELVLEAGVLLCAEALRPGGPRGEGFKMPVDEEMEMLIHRGLKAVFPEDAVISEETGGYKGRSGRCFVVDPHDGTRDFLGGRRETSISVGLVEDDQLLLGVIYIPLPNEVTGPEPLMITWAKGDVLRVNGEPCDPGPGPANLEEGGLVLISPNLSPEQWSKSEALLAPATVKACASVATRWALVATGRAAASCTILNALGAWDFAGAQALLKAAGGDLVGPHGEPIPWKDAKPVHGFLGGYFGARSLSLACDLARRYAPVIEEERGS